MIFHSVGHICFVDDKRAFIVLCTYYSCTTINIGHVVHFISQTSVNQWLHWLVVTQFWLKQKPVKDNWPSYMPANISWVFMYVDAVNYFAS